MKATRELGEVRITVCRSRLASDRGEMESARFLVNLTALRGGGNSGAGAGNRGGRYGKGVGPLCIQPIPCMKFLGHQGEGPSSTCGGGGSTPCSGVAPGAELELGESWGESWAQAGGLTVHGVAKSQIGLK